MHEGRERIYGRHPVREVLRAGRRIVSQIIIAEGVERKGALAEIVALAQSARVPLKSAARGELGEESWNHQGVVADVSPYPYQDFSELLIRVRERGRDALALLLDQIQDPQNLGGLMRTAEAVGVDGIIVPYRRAASVTPAAVRASAGASEHLWIVQANLAQAMRQLKDAGLWMVGLDAGPEAQVLGDVDLSGPLGLVVGGEGDGLRRLVQKSCDFMVRLPMRGKVESLNATVAGSVMMYAIFAAHGYLE